MVKRKICPECLCVIEEDWAKCSDKCWGCVDAFYILEWLEW